MEFQQVELWPDYQTLPQLGHGDAEQRWDARVLAGIDEIDRAGKALAVGQRVDGQAVFVGGHYLCANPSTPTTTKMRKLPLEFNAASNPRETLKILLRRFTSQSLRKGNPQAGKKLEFTIPSTSIPPGK